MFDALSIPLTEELSWIVAGSRRDGDLLDLDAFVESDQLPDGWKCLPFGDGERGFIAVKNGLIRLIETVPYLWHVVGEGAGAVLVPGQDFALSKGSEWSLTSLKNEAPRGRFQIVNYLGFADIVFEKDGQRLPLRVEMISRKLDYDTEYRAMTEDIADFCSQLLLSWNTPTGLRFSPDPEQRKKIKLEQFLFLRHFLSDRKFEACLEVIRNRPHSELVREKRWVPAGGAKSSDFLMNPMAMTRGWCRFPANGDGGQVAMKIPSEVLEVSGRDISDTPPNRFVRFALEQFDQLCREVSALFSGKGNQPPQAALEAEALSARLKAVMSQPLYRDCSRLTRIPLESQVLQKKEGYRDILKAWLLMQSASKLAWDGKAECYIGSSRNVDALYEYWIFLTLHRLLREIDGVAMLEGEDSPGDGSDPFLKNADGEISINLEKGNQSLARFRYVSEANDEMRVHLYYERRFYASGEFSWSGRFQPDYTLVMFPAFLKTEKEATAAGKLSLLHFDAKYRAEKIKDVFGGWLGDDSNGNEEKLADRLNKKDDLLKMHTYNDAIRRTAGSYVLYPGEDKSPGPMKRFHEILPGVGAFVLKPGNRDCENFLKAFLGDVFGHQADCFTQFRYVADATHDAVKEEPDVVEEGGTRYTVTRKTAPCVVHWMKKEDAKLFKGNGFAYCHAVYKDDSENKTKLQLDLSAEIGSEFIPCAGGQGSSLRTLGWRGKITGVRFLTTERLRKLLEDKGIARKPSSDKATHYLFFEFDEIFPFPERDITEVAKIHQSGSRYMAFTCMWADLIDCPSA